jgi:hypothetical protein
MLWNRARVGKAKSRDRPQRYNMFSPALSPALVEMVPSFRVIQSFYRVRISEKLIQRSQRVLVRIRQRVDRLDVRHQHEAADLGILVE